MDDRIAVEGAHLAHPIRRIAGSRKRARYNYLESPKDWAMTPVSSPGQNLPCPPPMTIHGSRYLCHYICRKKVTAAFDGGTVSSDGGVLLLAGVDKRRGPIDTLFALMLDHRDAVQISHSVADILRERISAIACGYLDGNDLDGLRMNSAFKMACGRLPENGANLASQPTISRLESPPGLRDLIQISCGTSDVSDAVRAPDEPPWINPKRLTDTL